MVRVRRAAMSVSNSDFVGEDTPRLRGQAEKLNGRVARRTKDQIEEATERQKQRALSTVLADYEALKAGGDYDERELALETLEVLQMLGLREPDFVWVDDTSTGAKGRFKMSRAEYTLITNIKEEAKTRERKRVLGLPVSEAEAKVMVANKGDDEVILAMSMARALDMLRKGKVDGRFFQGRTLHGERAADRQADPEVG